MKRHRGARTLAVAAAALIAAMAGCNLDWAIPAPDAISDPAPDTQPDPAADTAADLESDTQAEVDGPDGDAEDVPDEADAPDDGTADSPDASDGIDDDLDTGDGSIEPGDPPADTTGA